MAEGKKKSAMDIIRSYDGPPVRIMEVCGTHTHEIFRLGLRDPYARNIPLRPAADSAQGGHAHFRAGLPGLRDAGQLH